MIWVSIWLFFCIVYVVVSIIQLSENGYTSTEIVKTIAGFVGLLSTFFIVLYQNNLTFYFYWSRLKNWLRNYPSQWRLDVRFDGKFSPDSIKDIENFVSNLSKDKISTRIFHKTANAIDFSVHDTLHFYFTYQPEEFNQYGHDTIDVSLAPFEIGANDSKDRLDKRILPLLSQIQNILKPQNTSFVLNITFTKGNPFFALFVSHLRSSQISDFTINLLLSEYSRATAKDIVTVKKENIIITAHDIHSLKQLVYDFIYLSTNAKKYIKASGNA